MHKFTASRILATLAVAVLVAGAASAADQADEPEEIRLKSADGVTIFGDVYRPSGDARGVIALFHQGGGNARAEYGPLAPRLLDEGYLLVAVDQRSGGGILGGSNRTAGMVGGAPHYCEAYPDLEATLDYAESLGHGAPIVWGSSYSAALALKLASKHPARVAGVLAFSPAAGKSMGDCSANRFMADVQVPLLALRPAREMQIPSVAEAMDRFAELGHETHVADPGVHGSSMLNASRVEGDTDDTWGVVLDFLESVQSPEAAASQEAIIVEDVGFDIPESAIHDEAADAYLLSNVAVHGTDKLDNGFISRISPEGEVLELRWIDGRDDAFELHAPKGLALRADTLYVSDVDCVRRFHRTSGRPLGEPLCVEGAVFLNDLSVAPDGAVYVTDSGFRNTPDGSENLGTDAIHVLEPGARAFRPLVADEALLQEPNGVLGIEGGVIVVQLDAALVRRFSLDGGEPEILAELPAPGLDGIVALDDGSLLISSLASGSVYRLSPGGGVAVLLAGLTTPADIGLDRRRGRILIPTLGENRLEIRRLP